MDFFLKFHSGSYVPEFVLSLKKSFEFLSRSKKMKITET